MVKHLSNNKCLAASYLNLFGVSFYVNRVNRYIIVNSLISVTGAQQYSTAASGDRFRQAQQRPERIPLSPGSDAFADCQHTR